ncbi:MAG: hypothetical protein PHF00_12150, partial [Elusimicrobia bacterium]|nr:hypothetical protein [Elusimicrobiota bacterium]
NGFFPGHAGLKGLPRVEFGFPSYRTHHVAAAPFLGYEGAVWLANRLFNALRQAPGAGGPQGASA